jgi:hypothetical protein
MKRLIQIGLLLSFVSSAVAQGSPALKTLHVYDWKDSKLQPKPPGSGIFTTNGISVLKIENTNETGLEVSLLTITNSSIIAKATTVSCEMKYENVFPNQRITPNNLPLPVFPPWITVRDGLELSCHFPPPAPGGDEITNSSVCEIGGTSNWKPYEFTVGQTATELELKLSLPGKGTVYLRPVKLLAWTLNSYGSWWSQQQSGLIGGIGGSIIGCLGGLIGWLTAMGKARNFVLAAAKALIVSGILLTLAGLVAAVLKQPYFVWYALLLPGVVLVLVFSLNMHSIKRRYDELEIRRMTSLDATGG